MEENIVFECVEKKRAAYVDCRVLFLEMEFHQAPLSAVREAAKRLVSSVEGFQADQFVNDWHVNERRKRGPALQKAIDDCEKWIIVGTDSVVKSGTVDTLSSLQKYSRECLFGAASPGPSLYSLDYPAFFQRKITPTFRDDQLLKRAILELFAEKDRKMIGYPGGFDAGCLFASGLQKRPGEQKLYCGTLRFWISVTACGRSLDLAAEEFGRILLLLNGILPHANGRVGIAPLGTNTFFSPYMRYFGEGYDGVDGTHQDAGFDPDEWYPYYYLCGMEWMNLISSLTMIHLGPERLNSPALQKTAASDAVLVSLKKPISQLDLSDMEEIKNALYPALYPGTSTFHLRELYKGNHQFYAMLPRSGWELVPLSPWELEVQDTIATFIHRS